MENVAKQSREKTTALHVTTVRSRFMTNALTCVAHYTLFNFQMFHAIVVLVTCLIFRVVFLLQLQQTKSSLVVTCSYGNIYSYRKPPSLQDISRASSLSGIQTPLKIRSAPSDIICAAGTPDYLHTPTLCKPT